MSSSKAKEKISIDLQKAVWMHNALSGLLVFLERRVLSEVDPRLRSMLELEVSRMKKIVAHLQKRMLEDAQFAIDEKSSRSRDIYASLVESDGPTHTLHNKGKS